MLFGVLVVAGAIMVVNGIYGLAVAGDAPALRRTGRRDPASPVPDDSRPVSRPYWCRGSA